MASKQLSLQALATLIKAVKTCKTELEAEVKNLNNAANLCSQAMGNDQVAKKYIADLKESIKELKHAIVVAEEAIEALENDYRMAEDVLNNL